MDVSVIIPLQWCHNERDGVSNHQHHDCLLNRLFRHRSKKTSKLCVTGLCEGNSPVTGEFPAQMASNAENVSIWWRLHAYTKITIRINIKTFVNIHVAYRANYTKKNRLPHAIFVGQDQRACEVFFQHHKVWFQLCCTAHFISVIVCFYFTSQTYASYSQSTC